MKKIAARLILAVEKERIRNWLEIVASAPRYQISKLPLDTHPHSQFTQKRMLSALAALPDNQTDTSDYLYLYDVTTAVSTLLSSTTLNEALLPGPIIPDGNGGVLASWTVSPAKGAPPQFPFQMADVTGGVVGTPYGLPFSPTTVGAGVSPALVLGENGVAFASGMSTSSADGVTQVSQVASFNVSSGSTNWTYQAAPQIALSMIASISGNGLVAKMKDQSSSDTLLWFNSGGGATLDTWSACGVQYADEQWLALSTPCESPYGRRVHGGPGSSVFPSGSSSIAATSDNPILWANSVWLMPQQAGTSAAEPAFTLEGKERLWIAQFPRNRILAGKYTGKVSRHTALYCV